MKIRHLTKPNTPNWMVSKPTRQVSRIYPHLGDFSGKLLLSSPYSSTLKPVGYSFGWNYGLVSMAAHTEDGATSIDQNQSKWLTSVYVPLSENEYIVEIWLRDNPSWNGMQPFALIVRRNSLAPDNDAVHANKCSLLVENEHWEDPYYWTTHLLVQARILPAREARHRCKPAAVEHGRTPISWFRGTGSCYERTTGSGPARTGDELSERAR